MPLSAIFQLYHGDTGSCKSNYHTIMDMTAPKN